MRDNMSILQKTRDRESYFERNSTLTWGTREGIKVALNAFERFCQAKYKLGTEQAIAELNMLPAEQKENTIFDVLQAFVNHLTEKELVASTIRALCIRARHYLAYRLFVKIHAEDIRGNIKFPKALKRKNYVLMPDDIKKILAYASYQRWALYLFLASTGARIQEACKLRKRDFAEGERYKITFPASYTKTRTARITFMSKEAEKYVKPILDKLSPDDLVFGLNEVPEKAVLNEEMYFFRLRKLAGLTEKYETGISKITLHTFRSFFISKCEKIHEGLGHALAGHDRYMQEYERYTDEELLEFYLKVEPSLGIYSQPTRVEIELKEQLEKERMKVARLENRMNSLDIILSEIQKRIEKSDH